jgi:hypothetical protein
LDRYYGVQGPVQVRNDTQTGAGHPEGDSDDFDDMGNNRGVTNAEEYLQNQIAKDQAPNI